MQKTCTKCGELKPLEDFHNAKRGKFGKQPKCKACKAEYHQYRYPIKTKSQIEARLKRKEHVNHLYESGLKECSRCSNVLPLDSFYSNSSNPNGLSSGCKSCELEAKKSDYFKHREKRLSAVKARREIDPESKKKYLKIWYKKNRKRQIAKTAVWQRENRDRLSENYKRRMRNDPDFVAARTARGILNRHIKMIGGKKSARTHEALGYSPNQLREHIERQFVKGMSWDNYGTEWHIDHIVSMSEHIKNGETDPSVVNCLTNLMPLWAEDNLKKGSQRTRLI